MTRRRMRRTQRTPNRTRLRRLLAIAAGGLALACQTAGPGLGGRGLAHENLHSILWMQRAAEYGAVSAEIYRLAELRLEEALADPEWSAALEQTGDFRELPPAVILDIDETVLDNTPLSARLVVDEEPFSSELWSEWVREERARALPGAVAFAEHAQQRGVEVFLITNRSSELDAHTQRNLAAVGFPIDAEGDHLLSAQAPQRQATVDTDKSLRRRGVAKTHRVLLLVGDDLNDFVSCGTLEPEERSTLARKHDERWGRSWILLPNPVYGSWLTALQGHEEELPRDELLERVRRWLDIFQ